MRKFFAAISFMFFCIFSLTASVNTPLMSVDDDVGIEQSVTLDVTTVDLVTINIEKPTPPGIDVNDSFLLVDIQIIQDHTTMLLEKEFYQRSKQLKNKNSRRTVYTIKERPFVFYTYGGIPA